MGSKLSENKKLEKATFAAGCFWQVEEIFRPLKGVKETIVGYTGGDFPNPTYENVCSGKTGHAEAVEVMYDSAEISYEELIRAFWEGHDPTQLNRQGQDVGAQYRSAIFYYTPEQKKLAEEAKNNLAKSRKYKSPIVTEIVPACEFWKAEDCHQKYLAKRGLSTCPI